jgi:AraC-like DNA-binding protein
VSRLAGTSGKHLVDLFRRHVGVTPKTCGRILRFRSVIESIERTSRPPAELALAHGYADQAHLCREFKLLSGLTLGEYRAHRAADPNHVKLTSSTQPG